MDLQPETSERVRAGVCLSSGGAAGLAQVGALEELEAAGVEVGYVAGTSAGALVGAAFAAGKLGDLRDALTSLRRGRVFRLFDPVWPRSGLLEGRRLEQFFAPFFGERIEDLPIPYAAVATDLRAGCEVVLRNGSVLEAVRASAAVPGVFTPKLSDGRLLADGGLVNPLPVDVARALGAEVVIAVSVLPLPDRPFPSRRSRWDSLRKALVTHDDPPPLAPPEGGAAGAEVDLRLVQVLYRASAMVQSQIALARLAIAPPDVLVRINVPDIGLFELHRAAELVALGREAMHAALPDVEAALAGRAPFYRRMSRFFETRRAASG